MTVVFIAVLGAGLAADGLSGTVSPRATRATGTALFEERGEFCPPSIRKGDLQSKLVAASPEHEAVPVGIQPALPQPLKLGADRMLVRRRTSRTGVDVVGYGARVVTSSLSQFSTPVKGATAARCSPDASTTWYFAEGSSDIGYDERILLYNPFPAEAVVRVGLFTPKGVQTKANLADIPVHESSTTAIALNDFVLRQSSLGAAIEVTRGRVVAWRVMFVKNPAAPQGVTGSLGADAPALNWYFPSGEIGPGASQRLSILNPGQREATVTVSIVTSKGVLQPPKLVDKPIAPHTVKTIDPADFLTKEQADPGPASLVVRSSNDAAIVAERTLTYTRSNLHGVTSDVGAPALGASWALAPPSTRPTGEVVTLLNPGSEKATADVTLVRAGGPPLHPAPLQRVRLKAGARIRLPIGHYTKGEPMMAFVTATGPIVADRFAYSAADGDVVTLMGERIRPGGAR